MNEERPVRGLENKNPKKTTGCYRTKRFTEYKQNVEFEPLPFDFRVLQIQACFLGSQAGSPPMENFCFISEM